MVLNAIPTTFMISRMEPGLFFLQAHKPPRVRLMTSDHICCLNVTNNYKLLCHSTDLIRLGTMALTHFWTSFGAMSSLWWYIMPLGRQVNYKLASNPRHWWSPICEGNAQLFCVCVCVCLQCRQALLSKLSESLSKDLVIHNHCSHLLCIHI